MKILTRKEAIKLNLKRYFTGVPCKRNHITEKYTKNGTCLDCIKIFREKDTVKEKITKMRKKHNDIAKQKRKLNPEPFRKYDQKRRQKNPEIFRERDKIRYLNGKAEQTKLWLKEDRKKRPWVYTFRGKLRKSKVKQATPKWLTKSQMKEICNFYKISAGQQVDTGLKHHVDHIIPLTGENVCGLHVPWNLQVMEATKNLMKSNKII